jgi:isopenicillin-N N-acyltransferase-like protein
MTLAYPLIQARGSHRELGRQHGEQCRDQILGFLDYLSRTLKLSTAELEARAMRFLPLFERHCPHLVQEIEGLAEGAAIRLSQALVPQIRGELAQVTDGACTSFVIAARATAAAGVLIGQNCDMEPEYGEFGYVLRLEPDHKPAVIMWTFGGQIGYHGMNRAGVAHNANALGGGPRWRLGLPHYPVKRMMLEQSSVSDILTLLSNSPVCSNGNYVVCDGAGVIGDIEATASGFEQVGDPSEGFIVHTNHYLCSAHACAQNFEQSLTDSFPRMDRMGELVRRRLGSITVGDMKEFLSDHDGHPTSICRHPHQGPDHPSVSARGRTVTSIIAEPASGQFHVARGNPCENEFACYRL